MKELIVLAFDSMDGAKDVRDELYELQKQELLQLDDAAVVVRKEDGHVKVKQARSLVGSGALGGAFWGLLIGIIFWMPWLGLAVGAASGALAGKFANVGVDDEFIDEVADTIEPGHSALFMLAHDISEERVVEDLASYDPEVIRTNLSPSDEDTLRQLFAAEEVAA
ncbi:hypothetical protein C482_17945 [Natrialba chahannaoensis JCM 10990]|uniref:Membrane protein of uknown function UCP014873 n=1 Tax=Natrialba chahannaoensis JCM 10990 TaxID=1227492 RepID=M0A805_9EURY|nr:DUF1269 domain-containing protein [Natrialba chahannaoensis]ELY94679.1 hypothetical protein C482_17945 [Natrialba chahannaoensis JCM 10990]